MAIGDPLFFGNPNRNNQNDQGQFLRDSFLYDLSDPSRAFDNTLMDSGINPFAANPFTQKLRKAAPGLATSFLIDRAGRPGEYGSNPTPNAGADFRGYLDEAVKGGNVYNRLSSAYGNFGRSIDTVRGYQKDLARGIPAQQINPYAAGLADLYADNEGEGTVKALYALQSPLMSQGIAGAYKSGLGASFESSLRRLAFDPDNLSKDIWTYLMGPAGQTPRMGW